MQSSMAFASGKLDAPFTFSVPSATTQEAPSFTPASSSSVDRSTPVHSAQLVIPCDSCTVLCVFLARFPAHSMKCRRVTDGRRFRSSMVKISGRSTMPWIISRCSLGSISGIREPRVVPTKWSEDGVITPTESCSGAATWNTSPNASGDSLPPGGCGMRTEVSKGERWP